MAEEEVKRRQKTGCLRGWGRGGEGGAAAEDRVSPGLGEGEEGAGRRQKTGCLRGWGRGGEGGGRQGVSGAGGDRLLVHPVPLGGGGGGGLAGTDRSASGLYRRPPPHVSEPAAGG